jgi:phage tail sheath gpL-like
MADSTLGNVLYPLVQIAFDSSQAGTGAAAKPTLLIGQVTTEQPDVIVTALSVSQVSALCGAGSHLAAMYAAYVLNDPTAQISILPLADAAGATAASGSIVITGPATGNGTLFLMISDIEVQVGVAAGQTASQIAANVVSALNAYQVNGLTLPVLATVDGTDNYKVDLTANNKGTLGNRINISLNYHGLQGGEQLPAGVTVAITAMSGGATDPVLTGLAAIIGDRPFRFILHPYSATGAMATFASLMSFVGGRWDPTRGSWGHCFTARQDTAANLAEYGPDNNDPHSTVMIYETGSPSPPWKWVAGVIGIAAGSMRGDNGQPPQTPTQTLSPQGLLAPNTSNGGEAAWSHNPQDNTLLGLGMGTTYYDGAGGIYIQRMPTTYQTNSFGEPSKAYFDTEDMYLLMSESDFLTAWFQQRYARVNIAEAGSAFGSGLPIVTTTSMTADLVAAYTTMQQLGWVTDPAAFIAASSVELNPSNDNGIIINFDPYNIVGLRQIGVINQFRKFSAAIQAAAAS